MTAAASSPQDAVRQRSADQPRPHRASGHPAGARAGDRAQAARSSPSACSRPSTSGCSRTATWPPRPAVGPPGCCASARRPGTSSPASISATEMTAAVATLDGDAHRIAPRGLARQTSDRTQTLEVLDGLFVRLARQDPHRTVGVRHRGRRPGRLQHRPAGRAADHAGLGRLQRPVLAPGAVRRAGLGRQRREPHGPRASGTRATPQDGRDLLYIHVDEGVGAGLVSRGSVFRGDTGAAGDIGHIQVTDDPTVVCRCGQVGLPGSRRGRLGPGARAHRPGAARARCCRRGWPSSGLPDRRGHRCSPPRPGDPLAAVEVETGHPAGRRAPSRTWSTSSTPAPSSSAVARCGSGTCVFQHVRGDAAAPHLDAGRSAAARPPGLAGLPRGRHRCGSPRDRAPLRPRLAWGSGSRTAPPSGTQHRCSAPSSCEG